MGGKSRKSGGVSKALIDKLTSNKIGNRKCKPFLKNKNQIQQDQNEEKNGFGIFTKNLDEKISKKFRTKRNSS